MSDNRGVLWRLDSGELIRVGPVGCEPGDLFQQQYDMSKAGDKDTACTSLGHVERHGFDPVKFADPVEWDYRKSVSAKMQAERPGRGVGSHHG